LELLFAHRGDQVRTDDPDVEPAPVEEDEPAESHSSLLVEEPPVDARRARPTVVLHIHLGEEALLADLAGSSCGAGVARIEQVGPVTLGQVRRFLNRAECDILPVIDTADTPPPDGYEIPRRIREAVFLQTPASVFPWGTNTSRRMDLDHTVPYRPPSRGGPPGQTAMENLGPLSRAEHRLKTHGRWRLRQPAQGLYLWLSPFCVTYLVTNAGTQDLGENEFADAAWREADPYPHPYPRCKTAGAAA
jgi:hypothetical protein